MLLFLSTVTATLCAVTGANAQFLIADFQGCHGEFGPVRKSLEYYHFEQAWLRYRLKGLATNQDGEIDIDTTVVMTDISQKILGNVMKGRTGPLQFGDTVPDCVSFNIAPGLPPGEYTIKLAIKDNVSGQVALHEQKIRLVPD